MKKKYIPKDLSTADLHQFLLGSVAPRPIAFVSTIDQDGLHNLAPYSFFNAFSSNPPILVFSSNRRVENNTTKDTLANIISSKQCVVNVVNYAIVRQMMLCSVDFPHETSEFEQAGLHKEKADYVSAALVRESPVNMECEVQEVMPLGDQGGAGHLIICKVVCMHIEENILDQNEKIDPHKIDLVGRMGRAFYVRASGDAVSSMPQSQQLPIIGYPGLPDSIKWSSVFSANDIARLAGMKAWPLQKISFEQLKDLNRDLPEKATGIQLDNIHRICSELIRKSDLEKALLILDYYRENSR